MVSNRIRTLLADRKMSAKNLADELTDCNAAILSYIINGKALPTADSLKEMCELLGCAPTDLYDSKDVDLLSVFEKWRTDVACLDSEVGKWFDPEESAALRKAIAALGYYTLYRPPMPGAIPKCTYIIRDYGRSKFVPEIGREAWGYVDCERELTPDETAEYELMAAKSEH